MKNNCFVQQRPVVPSVIGVHEALSTEKVMMDGRIVSRSCYVMDDPIERVRGLHVYDFSLENQIASGVDLKEVNMSSSAFVCCASLPTVKIELSDGNKTE